MPLKLRPPRKGKTPNYEIRGTYLGIHVERSAGTGKRAVAIQELKKIERAIECGEFERATQPGSETQPLTFAKAALRYMQAGGEARFIDPLLAHFGPDKLLADIDQGAIDDAAEAILPGRAGATKNRAVHTPISAILKHAGVPQPLRRPKGAQGRKLSGFLWPDQMWKLLAEAEKLDLEFSILLIVYLYCGPRLSELLNNVPCSAVNLKEKFAYISDTKEGEPQAMYLPKPVVAALKRHPRGLDRGAERLFRYHKGGHIYSLLRLAAQRADVELPERQAFHLLRHTYATWMTRYGKLDIRGLVETDRWKDIKSADRYRHAVPTEAAMRADLLPTPPRKKAQR